MSATLVRAVQFCLIGWAIAAVAMTLLWVIGRRLRNYGVVDVGWTYLVAGLAVIYAAVAAADGGPTARQWLIGAMFAVWGLRLGTYLLIDRVLGRPEDGRYATLRKSWGATGGDAAANRSFFWFFQAQGLAAVFFAIPALLPVLNPTPTVTPLEWAAVALWFVAVAGESTADWQLTRFKRRADSRGRTCRDGLWRYSRHPNYFFEWLVWVAYALFASASPVGLLAIACPAVMLFLLFRITGIPATEAQAVLSRGDDYRDYQATTSAFVPWFPRAQAVRS